jgi:hypothetical protein
MRLRLKEDPKEWRNFALLCCGMVSLVVSLGSWRGFLSKPWVVASIVIVVIIAAWALIQPVAFRGLYRVAMTVSFAIGQVLGKVILGLVYLLVVTPMGWGLCLSGKDLLQMHRGKNQDSYWKPARPFGKPNQQF